MLKFRKLMFPVNKFETKVWKKYLFRIQDSNDMLNIYSIPDGGRLFFIKKPFRIFYTENYFIAVFDFGSERHCSIYSDLKDEAIPYILKNGDELYEVWEVEGGLIFVIYNMLQSAYAVVSAFQRETLYSCFDHAPFCGYSGVYTIKNRKLFLTPWCRRESIYLYEIPFMPLATMAIFPNFDCFFSPEGLIIFRKYDFQLLELNDEYITLNNRMILTTKTLIDLKNMKFLRFLKIKHLEIKNIIGILDGESYEIIYV